MRPELEEEEMAKEEMEKEEEYKERGGGKWRRKKCGDIRQ